MGGASLAPRVDPEANPAPKRKRASDTEAAEARFSHGVIYNRSVTLSPATMARPSTFWLSLAVQCSSVIWVTTTRPL